MKKERNYNDINHLYGRIFLAIAILIIVAIPFIMWIALDAAPDFGIILTSMLSLIVFLVGGFIEVITYAPMLGTGATYLAFITGNLTNLKIPCCMNARNLVGPEF